MNLETLATHARIDEAIVPYKVKIKVIGLKVFQGRIKCSLNIFGLVICIPELSSNLSFYE